ncbi:hypothetical protein [Geothrix fuzhouensis]|uniref:hypothetical protein n=1 Tax=Geothrix fuzhouensis TaxID=2966451 RepID=UPI002148C40B|nr:hypothetical protein [Geothrix fuzhouensis]
MRGLLSSLLLSSCLTAQEVGKLELRTELGVPTEPVHLVMPGCWDGLILGITAKPLKPSRREPAGATVEVWDLAYRESPRHEVFTLYLKALRERLSGAFELPPPTHQALELGEFMSSDPSHPEQLDLTKVQSMQERFNPPPRATPMR